MIKESKGYVVSTEVTDGVPIRKIGKLHIQYSHPLILTFFSYLISAAFSTFKQEAVSHFMITPFKKRSTIGKMRKTMVLFLAFFEEEDETTMTIAHHEIPLPKVGATIALNINVVRSPSCFYISLKPLATFVGDETILVKLNSEMNAW